MKPIFVRSAYNYDTAKASDESALTCPEPTLTQQHFANECDINTIVKRFGLTGQLPENIRMPTYTDYEGIFDFHTAMNAIAKANEAFDAMPADVRTRFNNNPGDFVAFCLDDNNRQEAIKLGLVPPPAQPATPPSGPLATKPENAPGGVTANPQPPTTQPPENKGGTKAT